MSSTEYSEKKTDLSRDNQEDTEHKLRKQMRQLESDHKVEKAVLEQKIELLEIKLRELEERETDLKKKNSEIMLILNDLNKKEDSALMHKVFEELELANNEKLQEKKQQQSKIQAIKDQLEINIKELKAKLEQSENEQQELEAKYNRQLLKYQKALEQERKTNEALRRELEEKTSNTRRWEEVERLKKMMTQSEGENNSLKAEYEREINKMKFGFERNLNELKKIHHEERNSFENRLKKTKELASKIKKEYETKAVIESKLSQEVSLLKEKISEVEFKHRSEVDRVTKERDSALERAKELEKSFDEFKATCARKQPSAANTERFMRNLEERLRVLEQKDQTESSAAKLPPIKTESRNTLFDQTFTEQGHTFPNLECQSFSLGNSLIHDQPHSKEQKSSALPTQAEILLSDPAQCWSNDEQVKIVHSKPNTRNNSRTDLNYISLPQTSTHCYTDLDNHTYSEKIDLPLDSQQDYFESVMDSTYTVLKDTSHIRSNLNSQHHTKRQSPVPDEKYRISYTSENSPNANNANLSVHVGREAWNHENLRNMGGYKSPIGARVPVNYPRGAYLKTESPIMMRRNGSQGHLNSSLRRDISSEKLDAWRDCNITTIKDMQSPYDSSGNIYKKGIQDFIVGLSNIKTKLEKQQKDILDAKPQTTTNTLSRRTRSFSNARLRPTAMPGEMLNTTSFFNEPHYRPFVTPVTTTDNRSVYLTDENSINVHNLTQCGEREIQTGYSTVSFQTVMRPRAPALIRETIKTDFQSRHRNSLV